jgi:hypothetical protein
MSPYLSPYLSLSSRDNVPVYPGALCPETRLRNSLIGYQLHGLANRGLELPKIHWMEG